MTDAIHVMGENTELARFQVVEADAIASYIHGGGKIGVLVQFGLEGIDPTAEAFKTCGHDVAMQVAAAAPVAANRESVDPAVIEHEMSDTGGKLRFSYTLDSGAENFISRNLVDISVDPLPAQPQMN